MGEKQGLDWQTLPAHPVDAWEAIAEVAFPGYQIDRGTVEAARRICDEPASLFDGLALRGPNSLPRWPANKLTKF